MEARGLVIIFGSLITIVLMIVFGIYLTGIVAKFILNAGIVLAIAWVLFVFNLAMTMNSDI